MIAHISDDGLNRKESVAEHTKKTAFLCNVKGMRCGLSQVMSLCGILHDMGKNKQKFHDYICADENTRHKLRGTVAHASTGAKYMYDMLCDSTGHTKFMVEMISYAVAAHHGLFDSVIKGNTDLFLKKLESIDDYDEACDNAKREYLREYDLDQMIINASDEFRIVWEKISKLYQKMIPFFTQVKNNANREYFLSIVLQQVFLNFFTLVTF